MEHTVVPEMWDIKITNPDNGTYVLNFVNTKSDPISYYTTDLIHADASANDLKNAINAFYRSVHSCYVSVIREDFDSTGA